MIYADLLEAQNERAQGHWLNAADLFEKTVLGVKSDPDLAKQAFYAMGSCYEQLANNERALLAYRQAVDADPTWIPAREAVAASLESLGRVDEALEAQGTLTKFNDAPLAAWVTLIRWSILRTAALNADKRDWSQAADLVNQLATKFPQAAAVPLLRSELLIAQGRAAEAEKLLEAAHDKNPQEIAFWVAMVSLANREGNWDRALQTLVEAEKKFGNRAALRTARAWYLTQKGEKDAAEPIRKLAEKSPNFSAQDKVQLWRVLASYSMALGDFPQAERLCRLLMPELPNDLNFRLEVFNLAARAKDARLMETALDEIRRIEAIEGGGPIWHYAMALRRIQSDIPQGNVPAQETRRGRGEPVADRRGLGRP